MDTPQYKSIAGNTRRQRRLIAASNIVSMVFSPLFIPVYGFIVALTATPLHYISVSTKLITLAVVATFVAILPLFVLFIMKVTGRISDIDISNRRQRTLPMLLMFVCYILATLYVYAVHAPVWLVLYFASGVVSALLLGIVTVACKWKISMHGAGVGNLTGMFVALQKLGCADHNMIWLICAVVLIAGLVGSARIILNKHTLTQVFCGTLLSALVTYFMMTAFIH